jgi:hypothetical protein
LTSSTKKLNTSSTTPSSVGFINLTNVIDSININYKARRDLSARILRKRSPATTIAPTLTADHIPIYFEQVFFLVQTSLYVCTAAGLLIFFSSLFGICGGLISHRWLPEIRKKIFLLLFFGFWFFFKFIVDSYCWRFSLNCVKECRCSGTGHHGRDGDDRFHICSPWQGQ